MDFSIKTGHWTKTLRDELNKLSVHTLLIFVALGILLLPSLSRGGQAFPPSEGRSLSSNAGLDLEKVYLSIETNREFYQVIYDQTLQSFEKHGLKLNTTLPYKQGQPLLQLTVRVDPLPGDGPPKALYYRKLELSERAMPIRPFKVTAWATTWFSGIPDPIYSAPVPLEAVKKDADDLVKGFIQDFLYANKK